MYKLITETIKIDDVECEVEYSYFPGAPAVYHPYPGHPEEPEEWEICEVRVGGKNILDMLWKLLSDQAYNDFIDGIIEALIKAEEVRQAV